MDAAYMVRFRERSAYESGRTAAPDGFPELPEIPLGRYTDPSFYALEQQFLWRRSWLYAAHDSELAEVGAYKLCDIAGAPILLVRGDDGQVRAFFNACRHRGAPVVRDHLGTARLLACQYHSWTYDLRGCLIRVPDERDFIALDKGDRALPPVRCESWGGWWFVNLDADAEPLLTTLGPDLTGPLADLAAASWRMYATKSDHLACNWKVLAEGFLEVYHARTIHPTTVGPALDTRGTVISLYDRGHQSMFSPVVAGGRNDGRYDLPMFDGAREGWSELLNPAIGLFPNLISPLDGRGFPMLVFWPEAVDRTRLDITWFVPDWGADEMPAADRERWDRRLARFDMVMDEDYRNLEPVQRSMTFAAHGSQVLNYQERRIAHVHAWIDTVIGVDRIDPALRVPNVLTDWIDRP